MDRSAISEGGEVDSDGMRMEIGMVAERVMRQEGNKKGRQLSVTKTEGRYSAKGSG